MRTATIFQSNWKPRSLQMRMKQGSHDCKVARTVGKDPRLTLKRNTLKYSKLVPFYEPTQWEVEKCEMATDVREIRWMPFDVVLQTWTAINSIVYPLRHFVKGHNLKLFLLRRRWGPSCWVLAYWTCIRKAPSSHPFQAILHPKWILVL
jgi:hypothetical protein